MRRIVPPVSGKSGYRMRWHARTVAHHTSSVGNMYSLRHAAHAIRAPAPGGVSELRADYAIFVQHRLLVETLAITCGDVAHGARDLLGIGVHDDDDAAALAMGPAVAAAPDAARIEHTESVRKRGR